MRWIAQDQMKWNKFAEISAIEVKSTEVVGAVCLINWAVNSTSSNCFISKEQSLRAGWKAHILLNRASIIY